MTFLLSKVRRPFMRQGTFRTFGTSTNAPPPMFNFKRSEFKVNTKSPFFRGTVGLLGVTAIGGGGYFYYRYLKSMREQQLAFDVRFDNMCNLMDTPNSYESHELLKKRLRLLISRKEDVVFRQCLMYAMHISPNPSAQLAFFNKDVIEHTLKYFNITGKTPRGVTISITPIEPVAPPPKNDVDTSLKLVPTENK